MPDRFKSIRMQISSEGKPYYINPIYPDIPVTEDDMYVITADQDRYDLLALRFYRDSSLWWVIACANNYKKDGLLVDPGVQLRIPANGVQVKALFEEINKNR